MLSAESWHVCGEGDVSSGRGWLHGQLAAWLRALGTVGLARTGLWGRAPGAGGHPQEMQGWGRGASVWSAQDTEDMGRQECYPG